MSAATLARIAAGLGVVLLLWGAVELLGGGGDELERATVVAAVTAESADTVELVERSDTVRLVKTGGKWEVNGHRASPGAINELFQALARDVAADLVARNPASHGRMGVDSAGARFRIVAGGRAVADLIVGERGSGYRTRYVRPAGDRRVFLLEGDLAAMLGREVSDWRDKEILALEPERVHRIEAERDSRRYALVRGDTVWSFAGGAAADSAAMRRLLEEYRRVTAQGATPFASPAQADSADFRRPDRRLTLLGAAGDTLARLVFDSTESGFWVRHDSGGTVYNLMRRKVNDLVPTDSSLARKGS